MRSLRRSITWAACAAWLVGGCPGADGPADADGDGYPDEIDCDDGDPGVHPGAAEVCGDGVDQDCAAGDQACPPPHLVAWLDVMPTLANGLKWMPGVPGGTATGTR